MSIFSRLNTIKHQDATIKSQAARIARLNTALYDAFDTHAKILQSLQDEIDEADKRAGQAWRYVRRYKYRVRELIAEREEATACHDA
jgi:DNA repair ATPase RecN